MAQVANPRKQFQFSIFCEGMNPFLAQKVTTPDIEVDVTEHGDANYLVKTGGIAKVGTLNIEKISSANQPDNLFWNWIMDVQNVFFGGGNLPQFYKRDIEVVEFATDGITIINSHYYEGCWPSKINGLELSRISSDNTMTSVELQVDRPAHI